MIAARGGLPSSRELFYTLVQRQLYLRGKRAWMGTVWPVVAPGFLLLLYVFVFRRVLDIPIERYPVFLLCGLLPWSFLVQTLGKAISSLSLEPEIIRKSRFHYEMLPAAAAASHALNLLIGFGIFVGYLAVIGDLNYALLPLLVAPLVSVVLLVMALSMIVALVDVYNHDLRQVLNNLLTIWFFLVPIVYRPDMAPDYVRLFQSVDPMGMVVRQVRAILYAGEIRDPMQMVVMVASCVVIFVAAVIVFRRYSSELPKDV
jgi:lipopolysaccharide transport system permease protein